MRKLIEDEIHDIIMRGFDDVTAATICSANTSSTLTVKDITAMLDEFEKLPKIPDLMHVLVALDGKTIQLERLINLATATEADINGLFRNHPKFDIDLTGGQLISFEKPKIQWQDTPMSIGFTLREPKEETNEAT